MNCEQLFSQADAAGRAAVANMQVRPMVVTQHANPLDDTSAPVRQYYVEDGVCGFAWVKIRPARGEFVKWLKKNNIGKTDSFEGGYMIWISDYNQSMQKKEAYARAFARVLADNGIRAMGCPTGSSTAFSKYGDSHYTEGEKHQVQGMRYMWLKWAALMAQEQGV